MTCPDCSRRLYVSNGTVSNADGDRTVRYYTCPTDRDGCGLHMTTIELPLKALEGIIREKEALRRVGF